MFISFSFLGYFRVLYLDLRLNLILFLSVTQVIRRLSLEIDSCLSRGGHVPSSRLGRTSNFLFHSYSRFKSGALTQQQITLTSSAGLGLRLKYERYTYLYLSQVYLPELFELVSAGKRGRRLGSYRFRQFHSLLICNDV